MIVVDLDEHGELLDSGTGQPVPAHAVASYLADRLRVPDTATDIVVYTHGWRTSGERARRIADGFADLLARRAAEHDYPGLGPWSPCHVLVRWPSMSGPFAGGYRRIRDRAHAMTTRGRAGQVLAALLGYLNQTRRSPGGPAVLRAATGQYLHCVGHSFGGRLLAEAITVAADQTPSVLGWQRANPRYPYTLDTFLVFQMAATPDAFTGRFDRLHHDAPINGPVVLTWSAADRAAGLWHRLAEGVPGIGRAGATLPPGELGAITLHDIATPYRRAELDHRVVNVDASWRFRRGRHWRPAGAHSDIWHPESAHLLLSLAALAR